MGERPNLYKQPGFRGVTYRQMQCPQCGKRRMYRPEGYLSSMQKGLSLDNRQERYLDVCDACLKRYKREDEIYLETQVQLAKDSLDKKEPMPNGVSLEDALVEPPRGSDERTTNDHSS